MVQGCEQGLCAKHPETSFQELFDKPLAMAVGSGHHLAKGNHHDHNHRFDR